MQLTPEGVAAFVASDLTEYDDATGWYTLTRVDGNVVRLTIQPCDAADRPQGDAQVFELTVRKVPETP